MVAEQLAAVRARMTEAALRAGRSPDEVTLIAVSKSHGIDAIEAAYAAGQRDFGENRAQELADKAPQLPSDIRWHFIGSLQRRKAKLIRSSTWLLHSLDRIALGETWVRSGDAPPPPALVQVNVGREAQKGGVMAEDVADLVQSASDLGLDLRGLMAIPPVPESAAQSRGWFDELAEIQRGLRGDYPSLAELSMGMTDDFEVAIEAGSTMIRVGRAIFGPRPTW